VAAIDPSAGSILGVASTDVVTLERGNGVEMKRVTVEDLLRGTGIAACVPVWDDLRFPAQAINPVGALAPPAVDEVETGFPGVFLFSGSQDNMISGIAQMPHAWSKGTAIRPHVHWSKVTGSSSAVTWELFVRQIGNPGDVAGAWSEAIAGTLVAGDQTASDNHLLTSFGEVAMTDYIESCCLAWRLYRRGSADADNNAVRLYEFDIHYQIDQLGTITEIPA
jgi:hypothetical protein